ncbi:MAG: hypothetical protein ACE5KF_04470 [Kiloniellaceae bacterium]
MRKIRGPVVCAISLIIWGAYFYLLDRLIMEAQGLPVDWTLMPIS